MSRKVDDTKGQVPAKPTLRQLIEGIFTLLQQIANLLDQPSASAEVIRLLKESNDNLSMLELRASML